MLAYLNVLLRQLLSLYLFLQKSWGPFWSYQLNNRANPALLPKVRYITLLLPKKWAKWAELAVLFSW